MADLRARPGDTSLEIWQKMIAGWRTMPSQAKARTVKALSSASTRMAIIGIRERHPDASDEEVLYRLGALRIEKELMRSAVGWDPDVHGR
ncbi:MAG: hypothetical protein ACRDWA_06590 [Acidimicrobiia bacterium]